MTAEAPTALALLAALLSSAEWTTKYARDPVIALLAPLHDDGRYGRRLHLLNAVRASTSLLGLVLVVGFGPVRPAGGLLLVVGCLGVLLQRPGVGAPAGVDGAERLLTSIALVLGAALLLGNDTALEAALAFLAMVALLEYGGAGAWKATRLRDWTSGRCVLLVLSAHSYGWPAMASLLARRPILARVAGAGTVLLEVSAPLALVLPTAAAAALLAILLVFHLVNAFVMGLNTFVLPYAATYPAVLHVNSQVSPW